MPRHIHIHSYTHMHYDTEKQTHILTLGVFLRPKYVRNTTTFPKICTRLHSYIITYNPPNSYSSSMNYKDYIMKPQKIISSNTCFKLYVHQNNIFPHMESSKFDAYVAEDPCPDRHHLKKV